MGTKRKCTAHKTNGDPCPNYPMKGQLICSAHGARAPQNRAAGQRRLAQEEAQRAMASLADAPPLQSINDVYDELLAVAGVAVAWRKLLQRRVSKLKRLGSKPTAFMGTQLEADVMLFERALDRSAKIGESLVRLDLEGRKQALDERVAGQLVACVQLILGDLNLTDEQRMVAELMVPKRMKEISA
jgi:hypothetical protein